MLSIDPAKITERDNYKMLIGSIVPRPIAFVTSVAEDGTLNGAPFSYFNIVSSNPPMISLSIQRKNGLKKDTAKNILRQKEFVVHIVDESNVKKVNETAANLPSSESEITHAGLTSVESTTIRVQGVEEAKIRMECKLEHSLELGGSGSPSCDLLIGKVLQYHVADELYHNGRVDHEKLRAVSRLAGNFYATIGEAFEIERPD
ncbi:flavin reductase family protein [Fredinandcohnia humi]